jgi:hypothetical protein
MQESILSDEQFHDLTKQIVQSLELKSRIIPMNTLKHPKYYLKSPVYVTLEYDADTVIAGFNDIEAFSYGDTESEAIERLCDEIVMIYEDLLAENDMLGPLPREWLAYLQGIIGFRRQVAHPKSATDH